MKIRSLSYIDCVDVLTEVFPASPKNRIRVLSKLMGCSIFTDLVESFAHPTIFAKWASQNNEPNLQLWLENNFPEGVLIRFKPPSP